MDITILNIEFGNHKIHSSRVVYSVFVKSVLSNNQIKKREVWRGLEDFSDLKEQIEKHESFPDLGITFKPFLKLSVWQSEKDPKIIDRRSKEFVEFVSLIQKTIFLLTISPVKFFCQGFIINYSRRRKTLACCRSSRKIKSSLDSSIVVVSHADLAPHQREWNQVKDQLKVAGGRYKKVSTELPELLTLSDGELTLLLARQHITSQPRAKSLENLYATPNNTVSTDPSTPTSNSDIPAL